MMVKMHVNCHALFLVVKFIEDHDTSKYVAFPRANELNNVSIGSGRSIEILTTMILKAK